MPRNGILGALLRLSKLSKLYPECLTITDLERDDDVLDSGRFGEIYKGRSRNQAICLKIIKVNRNTEIKQLLKVSLFDTFNNRKCLTSQGFFKRGPTLGTFVASKHPPFLRNLSCRKYAWKNLFRFSMDGKWKRN